MVDETQTDGYSPDMRCQKFDCDVCGFTYYRRQLKRRWDGLLVCEKDYEEKHERQEALENGRPSIQHNVRQ